PPTVPVRAPGQPGRAGCAGGFSGFGECGEFGGGHGYLHDAAPPPITPRSWSAARWTARGVVRWAAGWVRSVLLVGGSGSGGDQPAGESAAVGSTQHVAPFAGVHLADQ